MLRAVAVLLLAASLPAAQTPPDRFPAASCFPFETLPAPLRPKAAELLLRALDSEALYTIASDLKPMSSGIESIRIDVAKPDLAAADDLRRILDAWTCGGEIRGVLHHFAAVYEGKRPLDVAVFNLPRMRRLLGERATFFGPYGLSPASDPVEALMAIEYDPTTARLRGYGYLFGYPDHAVDFFVAAADSQKATGTFVERDFISVPTIRGERRFVYAVPKGHQQNEQDTALRTRARAVHDDYRARRARHITDNDPANVVKLVREWFDNGQGDVRPSNAWRRQAR